MSIDLREALDGAQYVEFHPEHDTVFAAWHGGHTVNFYQVGRVIEDVHPVNAINVGSFEDDTATLEEVKEAIEAEFSREN